MSDALKAKRNKYLPEGTSLEGVGWVGRACVCVRGSVRVPDACRCVRGVRQRACARLEVRWATEALTEGAAASPGRPRSSS